MCTGGSEYCSLSTASINNVCGVVNLFLDVLVFFRLWHRIPFLPRPIVCTFMLHPSKWASFYPSLASSNIGVERILPSSTHLSLFPKVNTKFSTYRASFVSEVS